MQTLDGLNMLPVWVNPEHLAVTAKIILAGHRLKVLGVVEGSELVGIITAAQTSSEPDNALVKSFMKRPDRIVEASTPLRELAETFWQEDYDFLPVVQNEKFRGIITPNMLLKEMARSWDPLTGLPWSDRLREWGVENLKEGREITIIFIDLDDFGSYNKKYGHIVGDRVLQKVAEMIEERMNPASDQLVRYGGDEFAVGTIRDQSDSMELARSLQDAMGRVRVAGSDEPVTFSVGVQGGKRTKERENVHYAATLDNLINLASKNSMAAKSAKKGLAAERPESDFTAISGPEQLDQAAVSEPEVDLPVESRIQPEPPAEEVTPETASDLAEGQGASQAAPAVNPEPETRVEATAHVEAETPAEAEAASSPESQQVATAVPMAVHGHAVIEQEDSQEAPEAPKYSGPLSILEVLADAADANSVTTVSIEAGEMTVTGVCPRKGGSVVKSVALATANAIAQIRPDIKLEIREVNLTESETGVRFISVIGTSRINGEEQPIGGVGTVGRNLYQTVAEATLQAYTNFEAVREGTR